MWVINRHQIVVAGVILFLSGSLSAAYIPKEKQEEIEEVAFKEVFLLDPAKKPVHLKGDIAVFSHWFRKAVSDDQGLSRKSPLSVPVSGKALKKFRSLLSQISESGDDVIEKLKFEDLGEFDRDQILGFLAASWFLKIDRLVFVFGSLLIEKLKELIDKKELNADNLTQELGSFLSAPYSLYWLDNNNRSYYFDDLLGPIDPAEGVEPVNWEALKKELSQWLAQKVLTDKERQKLRALLFRTIECEGPIIHVAHTGGNYIAVCSDADNGKSSCAIWSTRRKENVYTFSEEEKLFGSCYGLTPLLGLITSKQFKVGSIMSKEIEKLIQLSEDSTFGAFAVSNDHKRVALVAGTDLILLNFQTNRSEKIDISNSQSAVQDLLFIPHSDILVLIRENGIFQFWRTKTGKCLLTAGKSDDPIKSHAYRPDETLALVSSKGRVSLWDCTLSQEGDLSKSEPVKDLHLPNEVFDTPYALCFSTDGSKIALGSPKGSGVIFDIDCGSEAPVLYDSQGIYNTDDTVLIDGCFAKDDSLLATITKDHEILLWDAIDGVLLAECTFQSLEKIRFSDDGDYLLIQDDQKTLHLWYYPSERIVRYLAEDLSLEESLRLIMRLKKGEKFDPMCVDRFFMTDQERNRMKAE